MTIDANMEHTHLTLMESDGASHMSNAICKVCDYDAECIYDGKPMCYLCRENTAKAKREQTVTLELTEQDLRIIRRSIPYFTTVGAEGETTAAWALRQRIIEAEDRLMLQNPPDFEEQEPDYEDNMTDVEADANTLASCGWGTDEDYGYYGGDDE